MRRSSLTLLVSALVALGGCAAQPDDPQQTGRQAEVAEKGSSVMPFDLEKTTHRFLPTPDGLRQEVVSDDPQDATQVELVREHLTSEVDRFRDGDFSDPARIHGPDMPGLADLSAGAQSITITYTDLSDGAALDFRTSDPSLVQALHDWGAAQVSDHGSHAQDHN
ncbi:hypothetical protein [Actinophytocola sp. NPDC049390]|uniref:hypothetical protein n=1 Tax=Actinophytocola sp. NPDC049390 TaxID=3363894 RepID=UPI00379F240C